MDDGLTEWINRLEGLIANVNRNFGDFFQRLGCTGEICLERPADKVYCPPKFFQLTLLKNCFSFAVYSSFSLTSFLPFLKFFAVALLYESRFTFLAEYGCLWHQYYGKV